MRFVIASLLILVLFSCGNKENKPDISKIKVNLKVERFERDFFSIDTNHLNASLDGLYQKYPSFLPLYFEFLSPINFIVHQNGKSYSEAILEYYRNMKSLNDSVQKKYSSLGPVEKDLEQGFRYIKYYYPNYRLPVVYTSVESLNPENPQEIYGTSYYHDTLIISLQMFMGKDFPVYDPSQYFDYLRRRFEPEYIVPNSIRSIANAIYQDTSADASVIEQMVERGKQWWLLQHFLPDTPDSLITFFTEKQLQWCKENEGNIWGTIVTNTPDLYTVDKERVQAYLGEAPFTQDMPHEQSPGNIGQWVGWQIVKKYAGAHPSLTLQQVLATPARVIFQESRYKPK